MSYFCYLICEKEKVRVEAYQSFSRSVFPTNSDDVTLFLEWCRENEHEIKVVDEFYFEDNKGFQEFTWRFPTKPTKPIIIHSNPHQRLL